MDISNTKLGNLIARALLETIETGIKKTIDPAEFEAAWNETMTWPCVDEKDFSWIPLAWTWDPERFVLMAAGMGN